VPRLIRAGLPEMSPLVFPGPASLAPRAHQGGEYAARMLPFSPATPAPGGRRQPSARRAVPWSWVVHRVIRG